MASGKQHDRAIQLFTPAYLGLAFVATGDVQVTAIATAAFWWSGLWLSPDLDTNSTPYRRWGLLRFYWRPYRDWMRHRGSSHWPIVGSGVRFLYLAVPQIAASMAIVGVAPVAAWVAVNWWLMAIVWVSCEASALVHLWMDFGAN